MSFIVFISNHFAMRYAIILFIFIPFFIFGQINYSMIFHGNAISINVSPNYGYRFHERPDNQLEEHSFKVFDSIDKPNFGLSFGITYIQFKDKKWQFETGVKFEDYSFKSDLSNFIGMFPDGSVDTFFNFNIYYHYYNLTIPIKFNYFPFTRSKGLFITTSLEPAMKICTTSSASYTQNNQLKKSYSKNYHYRFVDRINIIGQIGIGCIIQISSKLYFRIEPSVNCTLLPMEKSPSKYFLYSGLINSSLIYRF